jgi:hypothetical protein
MTSEKVLGNNGKDNISTTLFVRYKSKRIVILPYMFPLVFHASQPILYSMILFNCTDSDPEGTHARNALHWVEKFR